MEKHSESRLCHLFAHLHLLSSDSFSSVIFSLLLFPSLTLPTSAFSSVHIVGSLTSKFPSTLAFHYATPHCIQQLWVRRPLQPFQTAQLPVVPSVGSLCHPCITTVHLSYSFLSLKLPPPCAVLLLESSQTCMPKSILLCVYSVQVHAHIVYICKYIYMHMCMYTFVRTYGGATNMRAYAHMRMSWYERVGKLTNQQIAITCMYSMLVPMASLLARDRLIAQALRLRHFASRAFLSDWARLS